MSSSSEHIPPRWLFIALVFCLSAVFAALLGAPESSRAPAAAVLAAPSEPPAVSAAPTPTPTPSPTPVPEPSPSPEPDWSQPVPEGEAVDQESWFADAVFIGDSRTDGFRLFSGVTSEADFLVQTGITVYDVVQGKPVIRRGDKKLSVLEALGEKEYGKIYVSLGVNELGYYSAENFADAYAGLIDDLRACQSGAVIYIQSIIPVNTAKCEANDQPSYVTNENIAAYNEALAAVAEEKQVPFVNVSEALTDETGEALHDLSADGVHFKREGYVLWLEYLTTHTGA